VKGIDNFGHRPTLDHEDDDIADFGDGAGISSKRGAAGARANDPNNHDARPGNVHIADGNQSTACAGTTGARVAWFSDDDPFREHRYSQKEPLLVHPGAVGKAKQNSMVWECQFASLDGRGGLASGPVAISDGRNRGTAVGAAAGAVLTNQWMVDPRRWQLWRGMVAESSSQGRFFVIGFLRSKSR
jgi:hypothetical protein